MKITAGLGALSSYDLLADAGADELFAGFVPLDWLEDYAAFLPLNRREVLMQGLQFCALSEMQLLAERIAVRGVPVALTFNSTCYRPEQYPRIADMLFRLSGLGFQNWILADPALMLYLRRQSVPGRVHLSGEAGCFSPDALRFFAEMNLSRVIFPRKLSPAEMARCVSALPQLEYEAFILNELCHYSGAFCSSLHCDEMEPICRLPYLPYGADASDAPEPEAEWRADFGASGCGLCALNELRRAGVTHLKVVGRGAPPAALARDLRMLRRALELPGANADKLRALLPEGRCSEKCYYLPPFR